MIYDPVEYERPCEYLFLYYPSHDVFRKQVKAYMSSFYFEFSSLAFSSFHDVISFEFSSVVPPGTGKDSLDRSIDRVPSLLPHSKLPARLSRWSVMESRHVIGVVRTLPADLA